MTATTLKSHTLKDLSRLAKKHGVNGWHAMRKDQLVKALARVAKAKNAAVKSPQKALTPALSQREREKLRKLKATPAARRTAISANGRAPLAKNANGRDATNARIATNGRAITNARVAANGNGKSPSSRGPAELPVVPVRSARGKRMLQRLEQAKERLGRCKDLTTPAEGKAGPPVRDRLVAMVRGPFWLHAYWELTAQAVARAKVALGQHWHAAKPTLRILTVSSGAATSSEQVLRDIEIHGGVTTWYIDVKDPPHTYRLEIGYLCPGARFYSLARSNIVTTPSAGSADAVDSHWTDVALDCDKIYAMSGGYQTDNASGELQELFEERLRRPMGSPMVSRYGVGAQGFAPHDNEFEFAIDAEIIIFGATQPDAHVVLQGEPVRLLPDGSFTVRCSMPNRRQVIPIVASSRDGAEQRTIVLAVERNTKIMEPLTRDAGEV